MSLTGSSSCRPSRIEESGDRLLRLIDGLLDITRLESGKVTFRFQEHDIMSCISNVQDEITPLLEKKSLRLDVQNKSHKNQFIFDKDHFTRVLINLISNAIKFSPEGAAIRVIVENGRFNIGSQQKIPALKIAIEDQGTGIAENEKELIFHKFIQGNAKSTKQVGSGLGLAICKEIVAAHGGEIAAENIPAGGARISFIIPDKAS